MSEPTLTLTPHELFFLPEGTPATAPALRLEIVPQNGAPFMALARLVQILPLEKNDAWLYFRDERRPENEIIGLGHVCLGCSTCDGDLAQPGALVKKIAESARASRYWVAPSGQYGIQLKTNGTIMVATKPHERSAQLRVSNVPAPGQMDFLLDAPFVQINTLCQSLWSENYSPFEHFLHFQKLSEAKQETIIAPDGTDLDALIPLFQAVLDLQTHAFKLPPMNRTRIVAASGIAAPPWGRGAGSIAAEKYLERWQNALLTAFAAHSPAKNSTPAQALRQQIGIWHGVSSQRTPTHHELIEATAKLREFLAPHLLPNEIEALFSTDNL